MARDNTVKYNWRTLQLLPGKERPSYAGAQLEVHEGLDGQLLVQYRVTSEYSALPPWLIRKRGSLKPFFPPILSRSLLQLFP